MRQTNVAGHLVALNFLAELSETSPAMSQNLRSEAQRGNVSLKDSAIYVRKSINAASGIFEILNDTVDKADGICSVNQGVLPLNQMHVIRGISIQGGVGASAVVSAGSIAYSEAVDNAVKNADIVVEQKGREVLSLPCASIVNTNGVPVTPDDAIYKLKSFAYLNDQEYFTVKLKFPSGVAAATGSSNDFPFLEIILHTHKTEKRNS